MDGEVLNVCASPLTDDDSDTYLTAGIPKEGQQTVSKPVLCHDEIRRPPEGQRSQPLEHSSQQGSSPHQKPISRPPGPASSSRINFLPMSEDLCWRCGTPGHHRLNCRGKTLRFCSRCGRVGTLSSQCPCPRRSAKRHQVTKTGNRRHADQESRRGLRRRASPCPTCGCVNRH